MDLEKYQKLVKKHTRKEKTLANSIVAFLIGGFMGLVGQGLIDFYSTFFNLEKDIATTLMIITLVFIGCLLTAIGVFDKMVEFAKCGLIIPITGFAHSMMSATLDYKKEGLITGIGANMFSLAGTIIAFGVISSCFFGLIRYLIGVIL